MTNARRMGHAGSRRHGAGRLAWALGLYGAGLLPLLAVRAGAQAPKPVDAVMTRVAQYVATFVTRFANVTAEERYTQERMLDHKKRVLLSDYLLVGLSGGADLLEFRDVHDVDGKPVGDRTDRLVKLLGSSAEAEWRPRAAAVTREASRYNLEDIGTLNKPLVTLSLMQQRSQDHFTFSLGPLDKKIAPAARLVQFAESRNPPLTTRGRLHGRIWVDEASGALLRTELLIGNKTFPDQIITTFKPDAALQLYVPVEMKEWYSFGSFEVTGLATYGHFQKFGISTHEQVKP
jgi:hypothetical protein